MREFFRGWRRKAGVVTLVLACVVTGAWVRSVECADCLWFVDAAHRNDLILESVNGRIRWYCQESDALKASRFCSWNVLSQRSSEPGYFIEALHSIAGFRWGVYWITMGTGGFISIQRAQLRGGIQLYFPHWFIVVPLTFISAWLLLSKPHQTAPKQTAEPAPTTGA